MRIGFPNPVTGRHVLIYLLGFFGVILIANVIYIWLALSTFNGERTENAYDKGLQYNQTLALADAQAKRPWHAALTAAPAAGSQRLQITMDLDGTAPAGLRASATLIRPTVSGYDMAVDLTKTGTKHFEAEVALPLPGVWDVEVDLLRDGTVVYRRTTRVLVP